MQCLAALNAAVGRAGGIHGYSWILAFNDFIGDLYSDSVSVALSLIRQRTTDRDHSGKRDVLLQAWMLEGAPTTQEL